MKYLWYFIVIILLGCEKQLVNVEEINTPYNGRYVKYVHYIDMESSYEYTYHYDPASEEYVYGPEWRTYPVDKQRPAYMISTGNGELEIKIEEFNKLLDKKGRVILLYRKSVGVESGKVYSYQLSGIKEFVIIKPEDFGYVDSQF
jgi:hypothetical protein